MEDLKSRKIFLLVKELWKARNQSESMSYLVHEGIAQDLVYVKNFIESTAHKNSAKEVASIIDSLNQCIAKLKDIHKHAGLLPFNMVGMSSILEDFIMNANKMGDTKFIIEHFDKAIDKLDTYTQSIIYKLLLEAIKNVTTHSFATNASIKVEMDAQNIILSVKDDGVGFFNKQEFWGDGLLKCEITVEHLNGSMHIETSPGKGCLFQAYIPHQNITKF